MRSVLVLLLFAMMTFSCSGSKSGVNKVPLTMEELEVAILPGNQETTLELMYTHVPLATDRVSSETEARKKAAILDADVAQVILNYYGLTVRFWKIKEEHLYQGND